MTETIKRRLEVTWAIIRGLGYVISVGSFLIIAGVFLASYKDLPNRTLKNELRIEETNRMFRNKMDSLTVVVKKLQENTQQQLCLSIAERKRTDWRECFNER